MNDLDYKIAVAEAKYKKACNLEASRNPAYKEYFVEAGNKYKELANLVPNMQNEYNAFAEECFNRANNKIDLSSNKKDDSLKQAVKNVEPPKANDKIEPKVSYEEAIKELNHLIGLDNVKQKVETFATLIKNNQKRQALGLKINNKFSYHLIFAGNPGTGKTTVARLIGKIYASLGIFEKGHVVEVTRDDLVAGYVGQTALKTKEKIKEAYGGILFVDEAHRLVVEDGNDFGKEALGVLVTEMENNRDKFAVIIAGYTESISKLLDSDPGLRSRFNLEDEAVDDIDSSNYILFEDYDEEALYKICELIFNDSDYVLADDAKELVKSYLKRIVENKQEHFGNARFVRNLCANAITQQAKRLKNINASKEEMKIITYEDVSKVIKI